MKKHIVTLKKLSACQDAIEYASQFETLEEVWQKCERGDWMLCLAGKLSGEPETTSRKTLVLAACACARLSLKYVAEGETRPIKAIETAERWANGDTTVTLETVRVAASAAYAAYAAVAADAAAAYAAYAAYAAAATYAAVAADAATYAATSAATYAAATYTATSAAAYAAGAARTETLKQCADIVRGFYPHVPEAVI